MRNVRVGRMETQHDHWLSCSAVVAGLLLMEECIVDHVIRPVEVCIVVEEGSHQVGCVNATVVVMCNALIDPRQHHRNLYATEISKLGRVDATLRCPKFDGSVCQGKGSKVRDGTLDVQQVSVRLQLAQREDREIENRVRCRQLVELKPSMRYQYKVYS